MRRGSIVYIPGLLIPRADYSRAVRIPAAKIQEIYQCPDGKDIYEVLLKDDQYDYDLIYVHSDYVFHSVSDCRYHYTDFMYYDNHHKKYLWMSKLGNCTVH